MRHTRKLIVAVLALGAAAALAACGSSSGGSTGEIATIVSGDLTPLAGAPEVYSDVSGEAGISRSDGRTTLSISASGLQPETAYVAHLHTGGCDRPDPGGPHFQFDKGGSEEPPNEIHLELTSNASGEGKAQSSSKREVPAGEAGSVVLHVGGSHEMTSLGTGEPEAEAIFVHEGVDHSNEGPSHEGSSQGGGSQHAQSDKIACAELEGAGESGSQAAAGVPMIVVRDGEPVGGVQELEYDAGEEVRFRVSSDAAEEIHVHGYDLAKDVPAGGTVEFAFPAELEGIYEAELEELGVQIAELRINP